MPLSRLENFLINTDGNILYVNPSDLDATDSFDNRGNSLTRPFVTIQRALLESARFSYQSGLNNDRFDRTTIMLYPGQHLIDNRPGLSIKDNGGTVQYYDQNGNAISAGTANVELTNSSVFDLGNASNVLQKFNSVDGGIIIPKGTSIVGMDLRKTKIRPLYVPDPEDASIERSAIFRVTGACYFWQFSIFDADRAVYFNKNYSQKAAPKFSHHKLTCFEYADGVNKKELTGLTDLQQYYFKVMNAYGDDTKNREITNFPDKKDFEPNTPEFKIVGDLQSDTLLLSDIRAEADIASLTVQPNTKHNLSKDDRIIVSGISSSLYNGTFNVVGVTSDRTFTYQLPSTPNDLIISVNASEGVNLSSDTVAGASPYIFNLSLRSEFGMCGLNADGAKATGFKSMVVAQFTGISLQKDDNAFVLYDPATGNYKTNSQVGIADRPLHSNQNSVYKTSYDNFHIKAANDGFIQAVSVFAIGFAQHFLTESGADQSITNSNSNFGAKSLVSAGFRKKAFARDDTGYITHIVPPKDLQDNQFNSVWRSLDVSLTTNPSVGSKSASKLFIQDATDEENPPSNIVNGYRVGARKNELLYLNVVENAQEVIKTAPVLMQVASGDGPSSEKRFTVQTVDASSDTLTFPSQHNFVDGETVRIYSDNGYTPDGIDSESTLYFVINVENTSNPGIGLTIKLAKTRNAADEGTGVDIKNANGGILEVVSRVTDKVPGDPGHPIQFDTDNENWFVTSSSTNEIFTAIDNNPSIEGGNSSTYILRQPENRDARDRIYKLRYVIPKDYSGASVAKAPEKFYTLQESSTTTKDTSDPTGVTINRNPRIISGITTNQSVVTVTTELPHDLHINDKVSLTDIKSSTNTDGEDNAGFNGDYTVTSTPTTKSFTYRIVGDGGTFDKQNSDQPRFSRNEYNTTYFIQDVETIQDYEENLTDGIYYLTCQKVTVSPTVSEFSGLKLKQDIQTLFPTIDKDNQENDPLQAVSFASNKTLGKTSVNDSLNSSTKEVAIDYLNDIGVGFGITFAFSNNETSTAGISTILTDLNHNLNGISLGDSSQVNNVTVTNGGTGYNGGAAGVVRAVPLTSPHITGRDASADITVNASGVITKVVIIDGGSAYGIGNTVNVSTGNGNAILTINSINNNIGDVIQVVGIGTTTNRFNSGYNGLYKITDVPTPNSITYDAGSNPGIYTTGNGIAFLGHEAKSISAIAGIVTTFPGLVTVTTGSAHGLFVGNKIKITGVTGTGSTIFNGDFIVKEKKSLTQFTINAPVGVTATGVSAAEVYKYNLGAYGQDTSFQTEKIAGSLVNMPAGINITTTAGIGTNEATTQVTNTIGFVKGEFLQVDNEIIRIKSVDNASQFTILRGVLGTRSVPHDQGSLLKKINVVPSEVRRYSSTRSSGQTFEYVGYGPGNYSTALPQLRKKTITLEEEFLAIARETNGGVIRYTGMNDRGDFFKGDDRLEPRENVLGEDLSDLTATFDDVYIRNTLTVGGGANRNLPSEFRGPVNFTNKITSTSEFGIDAIKLLLQGTSAVNPAFQVGDDASPSLIVKQATQNVGIKQFNPAYELDVNGTIRANVYENFKLSDLPDATEETTFKRNRFLKVKDDQSGYELVDGHEIESYRLRSYGVSNDPIVHVGSGSTVGDKTRISGIATAKFYVGEKVKVFGISTSTDGSIVSDPPSISVSKVGTTATVNTYYYWVAEYVYQTGKAGACKEVGSGIGHVALSDFNDLNHIVLTLARNNVNHGLLIYRQQASGTGARDIKESKLIGILGPKELGSASAGIQWQDYGNYDQTAWSPNGTLNEYDEDQIHFSNVGLDAQRRGWLIDTVVSIGVSSIDISGRGLLNIGSTYGGNETSVAAGTTEVKVVHDNTSALRTAIEVTVADGGNYLNLPSGTYLTNNLVLPNGFTLKGNGKNTVLKQQYFAMDATDGAGVELKFDAATTGAGNFIGVGTEIISDGIRQTTPIDMTIQDVTIDGNSGNNIRFGEPAVENSSKSFLVYLENITSSLIKGVEIRNSPSHALHVEDSKRLSIENCSFLDGGLTDRYVFFPIYAQDSEVLRLNDSVIENFSGPVDLSASSVVSTGGNIIRNCGTGLRMYATGKITTTNNILLGPSDEFLASPDIFDSDFNSLNITIGRQTGMKGEDSPIIQYIRDGEPFDIRSTKVNLLPGSGLLSSGIGTIINEGTTSEALTFDGLFIPFNFTTADLGEFGRENGYLRFEVGTDASDPNDLVRNIGFTSALGYQILAQEFIQVPVGYSTFVGIETGLWRDASGNPTTTSFNADGTSNIGTGQTDYHVQLADPSQFPAISEGDVIKLVDHSSSPSLSAVEFTVAPDGGKINVDAATKRLRLINPQVFNPSTNQYVSGFNLQGTAVNVATNGGATAGDYISIRDRFIIAKGRVGVTN